MRRWAFVAGAMLLLTGCAAKHGEHTSKALRESEQSLRGMKAAAAYDIATQRFVSGDLADALKQVEMSLSAKPDVGNAHLLRVRILLEMGQVGRTFSAIRDGARAAPADARFPYYEGVLNERLNRSDEALACYRRAAEMAPDVLQYRLAAAEMMVERSDCAGADAYLASAAKDFPSSPGLLQTRGHVALIQGRPADATKRFAEAYTLAPKELALCEDLARALFAQGRRAEAIGHFQRLLAHPDYADRADLQYMTVKCLIESDQPVEARRILRRVIRARNGQAHEAWRQMADVALMLDDAGLLRESATRMMSLAPKHHSGYLAMSLYQRRAGDPTSAVATLEYCRKVAGDSKLVDGYLAELKGQLARTPAGRNAADKE